MNVANTEYVNKIFGRAMRSVDVKNARSNYKTGLFPASEVRLYMYDKCAALVARDGRLLDMCTYDWEAMRTKIMAEVL